MNSAQAGFGGLRQEARAKGEGGEPRENIFIESR